MLKPPVFLWLLPLFFGGSLACSDVTLRRVELQSAATTLHIDEGSSLQLVPDAGLLEGSDLYWQASGSPIAEYQTFLACSEQDPSTVVHENGRDLLMIGVDETSAVQRLFVSNGTRTISVQLKITRKAIAATDVSSALTWCGIVGGFFLVMIAFVVVVRFMRRPAAKKSNSQGPSTSATASAKPSEPPTRNENPGTTKASARPEEPFGIQIASAPVAAQLGGAAPPTSPPAAAAAPASSPNPIVPASVALSPPV